jgi:hypothetical protein
MLLGISCHHKEYRLCYDINRLLDIKLTRNPDLELIDKKNSVLGFTHYHYENKDNDLYDLLGNKCLKGFLIPEQKQFDYLLMIKLTSENYDEREMLIKLKESKLVLAAYPLVPKSLKSKENLIF